mmetsp:Transcript_38071/g.100719  ORF Transcript_38071/g.100719 Transcript_38071/m.100719 type:complete len:226 (-) Transcript_38071:566-1243(-)
MYLPLVHLGRSTPYLAINGLCSPLSSGNFASMPHSLPRTADKFTSCTRGCLIQAPLFGPLFSSAQPYENPITSALLPGWVSSTQLWMWLSGKNALPRGPQPMVQPMLPRQTAMSLRLLQGRLPSSSATARLFTNVSSNCGRIWTGIRISRKLPLFAFPNTGAILLGSVRGSSFHWAGQSQAVCETWKSRSSSRAKGQRLIARFKYFAQVLSAPGPPTFPCFTYIG